MSEISQYAILFGLSVGVFGFVLSLYGLARAIGRTRSEPGKDVPATAGTLSRDPVWVRYHARYAGYALLFLAFDTEMAFMFPWAVNFDRLGLFGLIEMLVFIFILVVGYVYAWRKGALEWT